MTQLGQLKWYVLGYGSSCRGITVVQAWFDHAVRGGLMQCGGASCSVRPSSLGIPWRVDQHWSYQQQQSCRAVWPRDYRIGNSRCQGECHKICGAFKVCFAFFEVQELCSQPLFISFHQSETP